MVDENILSASMLVFMLISGFLVLRIAIKINKSIDKSMDNRFGSTALRKKIFNNEQNLERLVRENELFNWRVGLALSLALDEQEEKRFLKSLATVLKYENYVMQTKDEVKRRSFLDRYYIQFFQASPLKRLCDSKICSL